MDRADYAAHKLNHRYIGAEHLLLGLLGDGEISTVLKNVGVDANLVRADLEALLRPVEIPVEAGKLPLTPRAKRIIEYAIAESHPFQPDGRLADTMDILVGMLVDHDSSAAMVLTKYRLTAEALRSESQRLRDSQN